MKLNLNLDSNTYKFIGLCIIAIAGLIIAILSFIKPDIDLEIQPGGIVDPNGITIDAYLESKQGIDFMNKYFFYGGNPFFAKRPTGANTSYHLLGDDQQLQYNPSDQPPLIRKNLSPSDPFLTTYFS